MPEHNRGLGKDNEPGASLHRVKPGHLERVIAEAKKQGVTLTEGGQWWAEPSSHGGILLNGADIWAQQKERTPGLQIGFTDFKAGGGGHDEMLELSHED